MQKETKHHRKPEMKMLWGQRPVGGQVTKESPHSKSQKLRLPLILPGSLEQITCSLWPSISQPYTGFNHLPHQCTEKVKNAKEYQNAT